MYYTKTSFTLPATDGTMAKSRETCAEHGHMEPDAKGKCLRCAAVIHPEPSGAT